LKKVNIFTKLG